MSRHLVQRVADWPRHDYLITSNRHRGGDRERMARARDMARAWQRAEVRSDVWKQRPHHAFRKGFVSELRRAGADGDAVEFLVGHSLGLRGVYTDPDALPLRAAVDKIPDLTSQPEFGALDERDPRPIREITLTGPERVPRRQDTVGNVVFIDFSARNGGGGGSRTGGAGIPR